MWFLTSHNYPKRFKTPFSQFLFAVLLNVFMATLLNVSDFLDDKINWINYLILSVFFVGIVDHWRLWRQLEMQIKLNS